MNKFYFLFLFSIMVFTTNAQIHVDAIGAYAGLGSIKGNSSSVSCLTTSIFADTKLFLSEEITFRFSFIYARKVEAILPTGSQSRYFPFQRGLSVKMILEQPLYQYFFIEEGIGLLVLNDRTFSDTDKWGVGVIFHIVAGIDFRSYKQSGFKLSFGSDIGNTFNATTPSYFSVHLQAAYYF